MSSSTLFSKDDLIRQRDGTLGTQVLTISAVGAVFRMHDDGPSIYQGHGFRGTGLHTGTATIAKIHVDFR
jgi:hypothetical protein